MESEEERTEAANVNAMHHATKETVSIRSAREESGAVLDYQHVAAQCHVSLTIRIAEQVTYT